MADVSFVKYFEVYKSQGRCYIEERNTSYNTVPRPQRVGAKVIKIEIELDDEIFETPPLVVQVDMKESTKALAEQEKSIVIPVRHNIVEDFVDD